MRRETRAGLATAVVGLFVTVALGVLLTSTPVAAALTPHAPILIDGNANFTAGNGVVSGNGTAVDPYVITGWDSFPFRGARGFVWICDYDPQTKTLTVTEKK